MGDRHIQLVVELDLRIGLMVDVPDSSVRSDILPLLF